jgi:hypothetical protein
MAHDFSRVVEEVKQLSTVEKEELQALLKSYLIEERRREIEENYKTGLDELRAGEVTFSRDPEMLGESLTND